MRILLLLGLMIALMACSSLVPANVPPQLMATAGVSILITDEIVDAGSFTVAYPDGWRVVKLNIAGEAVHLVFVSPDERMQIDVQEAECVFPESTPEFGSYWPQACRANHKMAIRIEGFAEEEDKDSFDAIFNDVVNSIQFR